MKNYQLELYYAYENGGCGIHHAFELADTDYANDDDAFAEALAKRLNTDVNSDSFYCNSVYITLPDDLVAQIKGDGLKEYLMGKVRV